MILSNVSIHCALDEGRLIITPEPEPRVKSSEHADCPYSTSAVDLLLGDEVAFFREGLAVNIDLRRGGFADLFGPNSESRKITREQPYALAPNRLVLGRTRELIELPIVDSGPCLAARVEGKSSYARCGLLVHFTAPTIHAGFRGTITLELINLGPIPILLYPDAPICQLVLEEVHGRPFRNDSAFQGQRTPGGCR
ncbi:MAG TPA: dCTP deaminase [Phycisphaerae bacterium]|nr:dCTP deaminase [Phycisphaerales bacterium]HRX85099.1 dCTP deaminase [Phycisphaerae bacterium]